MSVTYATLEGEIVSESRGGLRKDYLPDPLGSTSALLDSLQAMVDVWSYWPYGERKTRIGTTPTPFQFVGTRGYFFDSSSRMYVRARMYRPENGRWQTVDPLWPMMNAYHYVEDRATSYIDPQGLQSQNPFDDWGRGWNKCWNDFWQGFNPPQPGGGSAKYEPGWAPWTFGYGNCCGGTRMCHEARPHAQPPVGGSPALDCLDRACRDHDDKIPTVWEYLGAHVHLQFCSKLKSCDCSKEHYPGTLDYINCQDAKWRMEALYCYVHVGILPL
ncbi:MAG: RHS repeat domain-containing protein [Fimbriimonas sp.]